jgi:putative ABC transport system permease protein
MTRAELKENFLVAMDTIQSRKGRSALTILGIVIGVTSVISVAAIITGLNKHVANRVQSLVARVFFVSRLPFARFGRLPESIRTRKYFQYEDAAKIRAACRSCEHATAFGTRAAFFGDTNEVHHGREHTDNPIIRGVDPEYAGAIPIFSVSDGRFISQFDVDHARYVCVLGRGVADSLFPVSDAVGQEVVLNGLRFEVIGIFEKDPGLFGGPGVDRFVIIPSAVFRKLYPDSKEFFIAVSVKDPSQIPRALDEVTEIVRRIRHLPISKDNDFDIATPDFFTDLWNQLTGAIVLLTSVISSIGLLVGGIGVMNIMLISVTERTQEIGVRKAVGARKQDIRAQFLIEAITLTSMGGGLGILLGATISFTVHSLIPSLPAELSALWVTLGFVISASVGLFFGYYPANRAANLDPIVCLRYE